MHHADEATPRPNSSRVGTTRLDRRGLLRCSAAGLTIPGIAALAGVPVSRALAQATPEVATPAVPAPPAESGYAPVNGIDLYYEIHGAGAPLLLLHGGFGAIATDFAATLPTLAQARQVIGVELQAHGHTADVDRPLTFEAMADDIAALIAHLGLANADIFGFSLGGGVALQTAIRHPEVVRRLVVASAPFRQDGWHPEVLAGMLAVNADSAAAMVGTPLYETYVSVAPRPDDWPTLVAKLGELLEEAYDWTDAVRAMAVPTLLIYGDADSVRPEHALEFFALLGGGVPGDFVPPPSARLAFLSGTTHFGVLNRPDLLLPNITPFLDAP